MLFNSIEFLVFFPSIVLFLKHPEYFADPGHLNNIGADIYTSLIS